MLKKLVAMAFAMALLTAVVGVGTAYAHPGHGSCKEFGERIAAFHQNNVPSGQIVKNAVPLNDNAARGHDRRCEPK